MRRPVTLLLQAGSITVLFLFSPAYETSPRCLKASFDVSQRISTSLHAIRRSWWNTHPEIVDAHDRRGKKRVVTNENFWDVNHGRKASTHQIMDKFVFLGLSDNYSKSLNMFFAWSLFTGRPLGDSLSAHLFPYISSWLLLSLSLSFSLSVFLSFSLSVYVSLSLCVCVSLSLSFFLSLSLSLSFSLSLSLFLSLSLVLFLSFSFSVSLSLFLSFSLSLSFSFSLRLSLSPFHSLSLTVSRRDCLSVTISLSRCERALSSWLFFFLPRNSHDAKMKSVFELFQLPKFCWYVVEQKYFSGQSMLPIIQWGSKNKEKGKRRSGSGNTIAY